MSEMFEISEDEDEDEVLRRSPSNTYYLEKMRVFEETFGIDKLLTQVTKMQKQIHVSTHQFLNLNGFRANNTTLKMASTFWATTTLKR